MGGSFAGKLFTVIGTLIIFAGILYLAYISTKLLGKRFSLGNQGSKNMRVLESMPVGQDKMHFIVKVGEKTMLMGSSKDHMEYLCDLADSDLVFDSQTQQGGDFSQIFKNALSEKISSFRSGGSKNEKK